MTTMLRLFSVLPGTVLIAFTWIAFARALPRDGIPHRWLSSRLREELAVLAFVTGTATGFGLLLQGISGLGN